jgi:CRP-like cAMP-binding protein
MDASESQVNRALNDPRRLGLRNIATDFNVGEVVAEIPRRTPALPRILPPSKERPANKLLASLPAEDFKRLLPQLKRVTLTAGENLCPPETGSPFAYFPETAVISHLFAMADGTTVEGTLIGWEGIAGLSTIFNAAPTSYGARVLLAGNAFKIRRDILKQEFNRGDGLQRALLSYAGARMIQLSQRAVCSGRHRLEERLCCWLLMLHDRTDADELRLTHELIASHLGVRRAGITEVANALRDRNIISYTRGQLTVLDREQLEASACECYQTLRERTR